LACFVEKKRMTVKIITPYLQPQKAEVLILPSREINSAQSIELRSLGKICILEVILKSRNQTPRYFYVVAVALPGASLRIVATSLPARKILDQGCPLLRMINPVCPYET